MKMPQQPRSYAEILREKQSSLHEVLLDKATLDLVGRYNEEYLHWDELRRKDAVMDAELSQPALPVGGDEPRADENLSAAVERHLSAYFGGFEDGLPPAGLYHRILREIEYPLLTAALAATRGNQIRAADLLGVNRNTLRKKIRDLDIQVYRGGN